MNTREMAKHLPRATRAKAPRDYRSRLREERRRPETPLPEPLRPFRPHLEAALRHQLSAVESREVLVIIARRVCL